MCARWVAAFSLVVAVQGPPRSWAIAATANERASGVMKLDCDGKVALGQGKPTFTNGPELAFRVSASFGGGETLALVDPETRAVQRTLYDAEVTYGSLQFRDGDEATIVWTRMSGAAGPLLGQAIGSDGDILALSIDRAPEGASDRPFVLFATASGSLYRGTCSTASGG
jgi:hypothetical protein